MNLSVNQSAELLEIIQNNQSVTIGREFGLEFLTDRDIELLEKAGIDVEALYSPEGDTVFTSFNLGMLSEAVGKATNALTFEQLKDYIKGGHYIPLTEREKLVLGNVKRQAFNDVKALNGKIFQDVNQILLDNTIEGQTQFLADELKEGMAKKETVRKIANRIAEKTGDWSRNFDRIIEYASNDALEQGKSEMLQREYGTEALVWKRVYLGACKYCIAAYTTEGIDSEPRIFTLKELIANGNNIGRKAADYKPVIGSLHVYCRCSLNYVGKDHKWNKETQSFEYVKPALKRKPIRIIVGGEEMFV